MIIKPFINIQVADRLISYRHEEDGIVMRSRVKGELSKIIAKFKRSGNFRSTRTYGNNQQINFNSEATY